MQQLWLILLPDKERCQFGWAAFCFLITAFVLNSAVGKEILLLLFTVTYLDKLSQTAPTQAFLYEL